MVSSIVLGAIFGDALLAAAALGATGYAAAAFAINFAVSQLITRAFADNPEAQQDMGVRQQVPPSGVNAIPIVYGSAYMGGTFVDAVLANEQRKMYYVLAISSISPNGQFTFDQTSMYYGDRLIAFDPAVQGKVASLSDGVNPPDTKIADNLFIYLFTSNQAGTITPINSGGLLPHQIMGGTDIPIVDQRWPATGRQMNGLAFAIVVLNYNRDADTTSLSPITFNVSHTLNGTGVAKPGDVWYDYITNKFYGGAVGWMPDGTFNSSFVNATSATALNTYSDELITFDDYDGNPATQARYRINGVLDAGQSVLSNIDRIMSACDSWMTYNAALGQWSVVINKAEAISYAFDDDNIVGEIRVSATDITSSINQVEARFPFKDNRDQAAFVNIKTPDILLYPNEPVNKYSITYDLVNDSVQTHYLANRLLEQAREDLNVSFSTTYYGIQVDAGQVVSVTNSDYGWNAKLFRVMKVNEASLPNGMLGARLELSEYNAQVYDNQDITQFTPVPNSGLSSPSYFSSLAAPTVVGYATASVPHFDVTVFIPVTGRVTWGNLYYTTSATPSASDWSWLSSASTTNSVPVANNTYYTFANNVLGSGTYYFAYNVGNDIGQSILSTKSSAFVWAPIAPTGPTGPTGTTGLNSATIYLYNKNTSTTPPTLFSGTFTYTFATGVLSGGTLNGWSQTPPSVAAGEFLFLSLATASSATATDTIPYTEFSTPEVISGTGTNGANTAIVSLFNKNTSTSTPPTTFSGTFTYTFSTAVLSGGTLNGWSQTIPSLSSGEYLWQRQATAFATGATDTIAATEFSSAVTTSAFGPTGATGTGTAGNNGLTALTAYKVQSQSASTPTFTTPTSGATAPSGWSLTAPSVSVGQVMWYIQGRYNSNSVTIDGVAANTTAWTGPIAANVFQDIRSDNWNGSTPPTYGIPSSYGTAGYYISQSTGNCYFNDGVFRADISTDGDAKFQGQTQATQTINFGGTTYYVDYSSASYATSTAATGTIRAAVFGYANSLSSAINVGVLGLGLNNGTSYGVVGQSSTTNGAGGFFTSASSAGTGLVATNTNTGTALQVAGPMTITNSTMVTNLNSEFSNKLLGTVTSNTFRYAQGPVTGTATSTFAGNNKPGSTSTNTWIQITINSTTYYIPVWT